MGGVLLQMGIIKYAYDVTGNMIVKEMPDGKQWHYEWSRAGHLKVTVRRSTPCATPGGVHGVLLRTVTQQQAWR
jgi:YD repeat-containing protein